MVGINFFVPRKESVDAVTRARIAAWLRHAMIEREIRTIAEAARMMGVSAAAISRVLSGDRTPGLDFVLAMWRKLLIPIVPMLEQMPPGTATRRTRTDDGYKLSQRKPGQQT